MKPPKYDDLEPIVSGPHPYDPLGWRQEYKFENGYGASLVFSRELTDGLEIAVLLDGILTYKTPITKGVICHLTYKKAHAILLEIKALPPWVEDPWFDKYLDNIYHWNMMAFIKETKALSNYQVNPEIFNRPDKNKTVLDICEDLSRILNLPLCTIFHQIIKPRCVDCKHSQVTWYHLPLMPPYPTSPVKQKTAHTMSIFEFHEPCPYHTFITHTICQPFEKYIPPQGCDCWRPN